MYRIGLREINDFDFDLILRCGGCHCLPAWSGRAKTTRRWRGRESTVYRGRTPAVGTAGPLSRPGSYSPRYKKTTFQLFLCATFVFELKIFVYSLVSLYLHLLYIYFLQTPTLLKGSYKLLSVLLIRSLEQSKETKKIA